MTRLNIDGHIPSHLPDLLDIDTTFDPKTIISEPDFQCQEKKTLARGHGLKKGLVRIQALEMNTCKESIQLLWLRYYGLLEK